MECKPLLFSLMLFITAPLSAKDLALALDNEWQINPYRATRVNYFPFPLLSWNDQHLYIDGDEAGLLAWKDAANELKIKGLWFDRSYDRRNGKGPQMQQLNNRRTTLMAGVSYQRITPYGALSGQLAADTLGQSNGLLATVSWTGYLQSGQLAWIPALGIDWEDARQTRYYYGIDDNESRRSGLSRYRPGASLTPWLQLALDYRFSARWEGFISTRLNLHDDQVRNSPMVEKSLSYVIDLGVNYHF
ncbi:outer membrane protein [Erwinia toletana]|uniref:Outer membrane protein n=1 Tax=Winslowiella toletana TaxID=92490 RepID=A0ABS4PBM3_9GAMM|nr:MipA/OmpV family protein [Winslowiella toletana]MBP2170044.1 outer membrane protein [Winslowiella toletana]